ncbi:hypothetical protein GH714_028751 [Hevea brasiliensis]|uniref:acetate--CoA ligase n=1 Tax=Hevea brasiliensis TaxID=3981 RepID=A0A6A6LJW3_HEVBR|nr:hypothetical protein GH714_028751 [Hevea brasiliensis]
MASPWQPVSSSSVYVGKGVGAAHDAAAVIFDASFVKRSLTVARDSASASYSRLCCRPHCRRGLTFGIGMTFQNLKTTTCHFRHVESMSTLRSLAGKITGLNAVVLGEALASEDDELVFPNDDFSRQALVPSPKKYLEMYKRSVEDPAGFWSDIASVLLETEMGPICFLGEFRLVQGRVTNICYNCLDRNVESGNADKIAIYWEPNEPGSQDSLTYSQLLQRVCQLANYLKDKGVKKGDAVVIYLPMIMELPIAMLACAALVLCTRMLSLSIQLLCSRVGDAEDPLFLLYTSGSTGKPKGVLHTTGGYMVYTATTFKYAFDYKPSDIYWCTADCGWITGHSYVTYGPMLNGATVVIFEGYVIRYSRKSLRVLGSVGEPINPSAWRWFFNVVGDSRCPISDTWWQTETGGFMITPLPGAWPQKPGSATFPFFGVQPVIVDEKGAEIEGECSGYLCVKSSWPGHSELFMVIMKDMKPHTSSHFLVIISATPETLFPWFGQDTWSAKGLMVDVYVSGTKMDITGLLEELMMSSTLVFLFTFVSGHRIGTAEVESALVSHPQCAEAAVVGIEHEVKGQGIYAFVTLVEGVPYSEEIRKSLVLTVRNQIGAFAAPDKIHWAPGLPKTRSGKIMRRILRKIASRQLDELGDTSTLADPSVVEQLIALADR